MPPRDRPTIRLAAHQLTELGKVLAKRARVEREKQLAAEALERNAKAAEREAIAFHDAVKGTVPLPSDGRVPPELHRPPPVAQQRLNDERAVIGELLQPSGDWEVNLETGEALTFLRDGIGRDVLRKLRRGHWVIQGALDLHGLNVDQARDATAAFLANAVTKNWRCVRIIHGKGLGSRNKEPVLKHAIKRYLMRRAEVLAFCEARVTDGGGGAAVVLLATATVSDKE